MSSTRFEGAVIEIIERTDDPDPAFIIPNDVRINGQSLAVPADDAITVHEVSTTAQDLVKVTLTLFAKRVTFGAAPKGDK